jgi:hypothetical protein
MSERAAFGTELRRARERRGLTLEAIAEQTKVSAGHFAGLERADLSRWPSGIFRRAFVRCCSAGCILRAGIGCFGDSFRVRFDIGCGGNGFNFRTKRAKRREKPAADNSRDAGEKQPS